MAGADQSSSDLPTALSGAAPVEPEILPPALPAPSGNLPSSSTSLQLPAIVERSGANASFAAKEFFDAKVRNEHTRRA